MDYQNWNQEYTNAGMLDAQETLSRYTAKTFGWMFVGLMLTFAVAIGGYLTGYVWYLFTVPYLIFALTAAELVMVIALSARISKMSVAGARTLFLGYAVLNGLVFSAYFLMYNVVDLVIVFGATALFFGIMALIGYTTSVDLSSLRSFLVGGLVFLIAFWLIGMFIQLPQMELIGCSVGIFIFLAFTAYDTQMIRRYYAYYRNDAAMAKKASVFAALELYLDFINLFLYLLRTVARKK